MYCRKCGTQIPPDGRFCPKCGVCSDLELPYGKHMVPSQEEKNKVKKTLAFPLGCIVFIIVVIIIVNSFSLDRNLIGRWEITSDDSPEYMEFYSDGTMVMGDDYTLDPNDEDDKYDYKVSRGNLILKNGETTLELGYQMQDDYLELTDYDGGTMTYHKLY